MQECPIICIYGNNEYRDFLVYNMVYEYVNGGLIKFGTVIGKAYPYYRYFSDNIYIKYDEEIMKSYLENIEKLYETTNGNMDYSLLIVDSNNIDLNTETWKYILENNKIYKITIVLLMDKITEYNINQLEKYANSVYVLKQIFKSEDYLDNLYKTFFKKYDKEIFQDLYLHCTINLNNIMIYNLYTDMFYKYKINKILPKITFDTYKIYEQSKIYKQRCIISDIINI